MNFIVCGEAGAGKDTFAALLGHGYHRLAFGDELRIAARNLRVNGVEAAYGYLGRLFGGSVPQTLMDKLKEFQRISYDPPKDRRLLQELGTWARDYDVNIWIRPVIEASMKHRNVVITDCRRLKELQSFPSFTSVYIDASLETRIQRLHDRDGSVDVSMFKHPAEQEIRGLQEFCDYTVFNNGTTEELAKRIKDIMEAEATKNV